MDDMSLVAGGHGSHRAHHVNLGVLPLSPDDMGKLLWAPAAGGGPGVLGRRAEEEEVVACWPCARTALERVWVVCALRGRHLWQALVPND